MTEPGSSGSPPPSGDRDANADFAARLARAEAVRAPKDSGGVLGKKESQGMGLGFRVGVDFTAAVAVGTLIGFGLDRVLGTTPWLMVVFLFLGGAAGVMNVMRAMQGMGYAVGWGDKPRLPTKQDEPPRRDADGR